jgi:hypothetical protein
MQHANVLAAAAQYYMLLVHVADELVVNQRMVRWAGICTTHLADCTAGNETAFW